MGEVWQGRGRSLYVDQDGVVYCAKGRQIYRSNDWGSSWVLDCVIPCSPLKSAVSMHRLGARLLRHDVSAMVLLSDGTRVAVARDGLYRAAAGELEMKRVFAIERGSRPLNIQTAADDTVVFGEYGGNPDRHEVHLYASSDGGVSFAPAYTFPAGDIRHIHNVVYDPHVEKYWVLVGDYGDEPGIALMDRDFQDLEWVVRGTQSARVVSAIIEEDGLLFGTDTELEKNTIVRLDRHTGALSVLRDIDGASLFATRFGDLRLIASDVEPSQVNPSRVARLYASRDGDSWQVVDSRQKDMWSMHYFQFGTFVLPYSEYAGDRGCYSGQALRGFDGSLRVFNTDDAMHGSLQ